MDTKKQNEQQDKKAAADAGCPPCGPADPLKQDDGFEWARRIAEAEDAGLD